MPKIPEGPTWTDRTVTITMVDGTQLRVKARVYGSIAVYPAAGSREVGRWAVGSTTTGLQVALMPTEEDALAIGRVLWERGCLAFRQLIRGKVLEKMPPDLLRWVFACRQAGKYLPYRANKETVR